MKMLGYLEVLKNVLICVLLFIAILTSWSNSKTASEIIQEITTLKAVMYEQTDEIDHMNQRVEAVLREE